MTWATSGSYSVFLSFTCQGDKLGFSPVNLSLLQGSLRQPSRGKLLPSATQAVEHNSKQKGMNLNLEEEGVLPKVTSQGDLIANS